MTHSTSLLKFIENGIVRELSARVVQLKKNGNTEVLYTQCGHSINLDNLLSVDGVLF